MKCSKCNAELQPGDELRWECNVCHQMCRANLSMLEQIQTQRDQGYTATMVNCPFCGAALDDGNETIHWHCTTCGGQTTGSIKNYLKPELLVENEVPLAEGPSVGSEIAWLDTGGETIEAPVEEKTDQTNGFFADEAAKNEFLAETTSQALGEEIPDSVFEDAFPIRKKKEESADEQASVPAGEPVDSPFVEPSANEQVGVPAGEPVDSPFVEPSANEQVGVPAGASVDSPFVEPSANEQMGAPTEVSADRPLVESSVSEPTDGLMSKSRSDESVNQPVRRQTEEAKKEPEVSTEAESSKSETGRSETPTSSYEYAEPPVKQIWPKVITGVLGVMVGVVVIVGAVLTVSYFIAPTTQFRSAVKTADYTKAKEIYDSKIKGDADDERIAQIAVEHYLNETFKAYKNGTGDASSYEKIKDFAETEMRISTSDYELETEVAATAVPTASAAPTEIAAEATEPPEATAEVTEVPAATEDVAAVPEETAEPTPEATGSPEETGDTQLADGDITAALAQAKEYVKKKKYEKAYNYLADYKDIDTTGQIKEEMTSIKKKWKSYNIKTFKALCEKLTIVYSASEQRYHIVPRGYYTNYNQICRSNNVGGIAYMDKEKKKVSITNIGKADVLSSFGKTNRAYLKKFKKMIEKYPYLGKEI